MRLTKKGNGELKMDKKIYIAGKITGDSGYKEKFNKTQKGFENAGYKVMNPAILPEGFPWESYMPICYGMIEACDEIAMLPDWRESKGARLEMVHAIKCDKIIILL